MLGKSWEHGGSDRCGSGVMGAGEWEREGRRDGLGRACGSGRAEMEEGRIQEQGRRYLH